MNLPLKYAILATRRRQADIAGVTGISESRLARIVNERVTARPGERARLAAALNVPVEALFGDVTGKA